MSQDTELEVSQRKEAARKERISLDEEHAKDKILHDELHKREEYRIKRRVEVDNIICRP